jgi:uncharacterized protein YfkK (UPF0435 family)
MGTLHMLHALRNVILLKPQQEDNNTREKLCMIYDVVTVG